MLGVLRELLSHKYGHFTGTRSLQKMKHKRFLSWSFIALSMLFSSSNLFGELGTTYGSPDLGSHNTKYKIIISSQEFYRHYFYCLVTCKASLGSPFAKQAGMQLSEVLVLVHVLLISVNPLHTVPSGFFLMHGTDWMKAVSLKQRSAVCSLNCSTDSNASSHLFFLDP